MDDKKIDDHDNDPPELGGYTTLGRLRLEGVNCFAKTVNSRVFAKPGRGGS